VTGTPYVIGSGIAVIHVPKSSPAPQHCESTKVNLSSVFTVKFKNTCFFNTLICCYFSVYCQPHQKKKPYFGSKMSTAPSVGAVSATTTVSAAANASAAVSATAAATAPSRDSTACASAVAHKAEISIATRTLTQGMAYDSSSEDVKPPMIPLAAPKAINALGGLISADEEYVATGIISAPELPHPLASPKIESTQGRMLTTEGSHAEQTENILNPRVVLKSAVKDTTSEVGMSLAAPMRTSCLGAASVQHRVVLSNAFQGRDLADEPVKRKRGRPRKIKPGEEDEAAKAAASQVSSKMLKVGSSPNSDALCPHCSLGMGGLKSTVVYVEFHCCFYPTQSNIGPELGYAI
jgi:hypothetical protein